MSFSVDLTALKKELVSNDGNSKLVVGDGGSTTYTLPGTPGAAGTVLTLNSGQQMEWKAVDMGNDAKLLPLNNLSDVTNRQTALNTLTAASSASQGDVLLINSAGNAVFAAAAVGASSSTATNVEANVYDFSYTVTESNGAFLLDGVSKPSITVKPGGRYKFDVTNVPSTHFFAITTESVRATSLYSNGVTNNAANGDSESKVVVIEIPQSPGMTLYYNCTAHDNMGAIILYDESVDYKLSKTLNLTDLYDRQVSLNNLTDAASGVATAVLQLDASKNAVFSVFKSSDNDENKLLRGNGTFSSSITPATVSASRVTMSNTPTNATDLCNKSYVDSLVSSNLTWLDQVRVATTANITLSGTQTIDSVALSAGDRVLVKDQTNKTQNGLYVVGSASWARANDFTNGASVSGKSMFVKEGSNYASTGWTCNSASDADVVGTDEMTFVLLTSEATVAGDGLVRNGSVLSVDVDNSSITVNATTSKLQAVKLSAATGGGSLSIDDAATAAYVIPATTPTEGQGLVIDSGNTLQWTTVETLKNKTDATAAPTATDDSSAGYAVGSKWVDVTNDMFYICVDASAGSAVWQAGGSSPEVFTGATASSDGSTGLVPVPVTGNESATLLGNATWLKNKTDATAAPTVTDDSAAGYAVGSKWIDVTNDQFYICVDASAGSAVWSSGGGGGGGGGSMDTEYMVVGLSVNQSLNISSGHHVQFNTLLTGQSSSGNLTTSSIQLDSTSGYSTASNTASVGRFLLKAGRSYELSSVVEAEHTDTGYEYRYAWYDADTNTKLSRESVSRRHVFSADVVVGDVGSASGSATVSGFVTSASMTSLSIGNSGTTVDISYSLPSVPHLQVTYEADINTQNNDVSAPMVWNISNTGAKIWMEESASVVQNITLHITAVCNTSTVGSNPGATCIVSPLVDTRVEVRMTSSPGPKRVLNDKTYAKILKISDISATNETKDKLDATAAPTATDDSAAGYAVGSKWIDVTNDQFYICVDASAGSAVWSSGGGGGETLTNASEFAYGRMYSVGTDTIGALTSSFALYDYYSGNETNINMTSDTSTGKFTVQLSGKYEISFSFSDHDSSSDRCVTVYKNGTESGRGIWTHSDSIGNNIRVTFPVMDLVASDYVQIYWKCSTGSDAISTQSRDAEIASFTIKLVSGTLGIPSIPTSRNSGEILISDGTTTKWKRLDPPATAGTKVLQYVSGSDITWQDASTASVTFAYGRMWNLGSDPEPPNFSSSPALWSAWANNDTPINMTIDLATGKFTIQVPGYYRGAFYCAETAADNDRNYQIYKNGVAQGTALVSQYIGSQTVNNTIMFPVYYYDTGDEVQLYAFASGSDNTVYQSRTTEIASWFELSMVAGVQSTQLVVSSNTSATLKAVHSWSSSSTSYDISDFWTGTDNRELRIIFETEAHSHQLNLHKDMKAVYAGQSFEFIKYSGGNYVIVYFPTDMNSFTANSIGSGRQLEKIHIYYVKQTTAATGAAVPENVNEFPKRWVFGKKRALWAVGMGTPAENGFTLYGNASFSISDITSRLNLTSNGTNQQGTVYIDLGTSYTNWEMRARVRVVPGSTDGDGIVLYGNSTDGTKTYDPANTQYYDTTGYAVVFHRYSNGHFCVLSNGVDALKTEGGFGTRTTGAAFDSKAHVYIFRRIGNTLTVELQSTGTYASYRLEATDSTSNVPTGSVWGIGARTGGATQWAQISHLEIRSLGDSASSVVDEVD